MWDRSEPGVRYVVSPNGYKFECTKDGAVCEGTENGGYWDTEDETWDFDYGVERFTWDAENDGEELEGVEDGDEEVDADEHDDFEQDGGEESWEEGEGTNVDNDEDGDNDVEEDECEGGGENDED